MIQLQLDRSDLDTLQQALIFRPPGDNQAALFSTYGDFRPRGGPTTFNADAAWARVNIASLDLGLPNLAGTRHGVVDLHRLIIPVTRIAFREIARLGLAPAIRRWNGAWNVRQMRTGGAWSLHSWGIAFDLNANSNGQGAGAGDMDPRVVQLLEMCGFTWGGRWSGGFIDPMHFQFADPLPGVSVPAWQDAAAKGPPSSPSATQPTAPALTPVNAKGARLILNGQDLGEIDAATLGGGKLQVNTP